MKAQRGIAVYLYSFFNLGASWRWVVNATPRPLYFRERDLLSIVKEEGGWASGPVCMVQPVESPCRFITFRATYLWPDRSRG
jgi:hypothetical protein